MNLSPTQKELISRGTMAVVAIALGIGATKLLLGAVHAAAASPENAVDSLEALAGILLPLAVLMYILALTLACFVFCAWDKRKSNLGRTMVVGDFVRKFMEAIFTRTWDDN